MLILLGVIRCGLTGCPQEKTALDHLDRYPWWPDHLDLDRYEGVQEEARRFPFQTGYAPGSTDPGASLMLVRFSVFQVNSICTPYPIHSGAS
jgi:hypothetical protein